MSSGLTALRIFVWLGLKCVNLFYIPLFISRLFKKSKICPPINNEILLLPAGELADKIRRQEVTSEAAVRAYISRIEEVNPIINAVIEDRFKQAIEDAKYADKLVSFGTMSVEELKEKHPLLGVPLTVKGSIEVANMKSTSGSILRAKVTAKKDAVAVQYAREAGAIPLLTSNIPEFCMNWESCNKLKGRTKNPHNTCRTSGGSSGGEASLLASGGSLIGIGSDVGGSLRLPAHFCGVWGHKPSPRAVSYVGHYPSCKNHKEWEMAFTLGPMARYASDLKLLFGAIIKPEMKDCLMLDIPVSLKEIRVHYIENIDSLLTTKVSSDSLEALHNIVHHFNNICYNNAKEVKFPLMKYAPEMAALDLFDINDVDNPFPGHGKGCYKELFKYITGRSQMTFNLILYGILRRMSGYLPRSIFKDSKEKLVELKNNFISLLGSDGVLIIPTFPMEACHHGDILRYAFNASYLWIFNALGLPVTDCPVTVSRNGLPIGVQVVAAPNCDRLTLAVAMEIEKAFGGWKSLSMSKRN